MLRGDVYAFRLPNGRGHEQRGRRYGVVVQANELLPRSVVLVAPTPRSAKPASFRPEIDVEGEATRVLVEQVGAIGAGASSDMSPRTAVGYRRGAAHGSRSALTAR